MESNDPPGMHAYNATVVEFDRIHTDLAIMRVLPDFGQLKFSPGQYTVLGLGAWEPRIPETQPEPARTDPHRLIQRAYSIGCSLLDGHGKLVRATHSPVLEFYVTLVRTARVPPALTPRLFALSRGRRLYCGPHAHGHYGLDGVRPDDTVIFAATGTGEAPHNAMLAELLSRAHRGRIVSVCCVRYRKDLAYLARHRALQETFPNYRYVPLTTREPENTEPTHPEFVGKRYLQDYFDSGDFTRETNCPLDPDHSHIFLCGSPDMIGAPGRSHDGSRHGPAPRGMVDVLLRRGFEVDLPHKSGNLHFELYW
jgi:ferredoxin--NADP+ reductase